MEGEEEIKNEDVFAKAEDVTKEEIGKKEEKLPIANDAPEESEDISEDELIDENFKPTISSKSAAEIEKEKGVKKAMDGKVVTIKTIEIMPPKTKKVVNDKVVKLEPKLTQSGKGEFYPTKLRLRFEEENLVEYYPTVRIWVNDGKLNENIRLDRVSNSKVSQLIRLALLAMNPSKFELVEATVNEKIVKVVSEKTKPVFEAISKIISDVEIFKWMTGKKVKLLTATGVYDGREWLRNDIVEFIL